MRRALTRRQIVLGMMIGAVTIHGKVQAGQSAQGARRQILLPLDAVDDIVIRYRGRQIVMTPQQVMDELGAK